MRRAGASTSLSNKADVAATAAIIKKKRVAPSCVQNEPSPPASRLPAKLAENHIAMVVAASAPGASRPNNATGRQDEELTGRKDI